MRSGKLRIKVLRGLTESNITPRKNSVVPTVEMTAETSRPVNIKYIYLDFYTCDPLFKKR